MNIVISWLTYLTKNNFLERYTNVVQSYTSLSLLKNAKIVVVDNSEYAGTSYYNSAHAVKNDGYDYFYAGNKLLDVAAHYVALDFALKMEAKYFIYTYDDFVFYDGCFIDDAISFMDTNKEVSCIRLPKYEVDNINYYDRDITGKHVNPEAVAHKKGGTRNQDVIHYEMQTFGTHVFYKSNWRPQSRPTMWRTEDFIRIVGYPNPCPVMQGFEKHMHDCADIDMTYVSGFIDNGVCHTFPQDTSTRIKAGNNFGNVDLQLICNELNLMHGTCKSSCTL